VNDMHCLTLDMWRRPNAKGWSALTLLAQFYKFMCIRKGIKWRQLAPENHDSANWMEGRCVDGMCV